MTPASDTTAVPPQDQSRLPAPDVDRSIFDGLPTLVLLSDAQGLCIYCNRAWFDFTGRNLAEEAGEGWLAGVHSDDAASCRRVLAGALQQRTRFEIEYRLRQRTGEYGWIVHDAAPLADGNGVFTGYISVCVDISQQKLAELAARNREAEIRLLADNVPVLIAYTDVKEQRYSFANKAYARTYGWTEQTIIGQTVRTVIGEEAYNLIQPHIDKVLSGREVNYQRPLTTGDGQRRFIEVNLIPRFDEAKTLVGAFILINDITRHHLAEQAARESQERLEKFAAASNDGIVFHDDGLLTDCNEAALRLFGYERAEVDGRKLLEYLAPECWEQVTHHIRARSDGVCEGFAVHKTGRHIPVEITLKEMPYQGRLYRMTVIRDITERKRAEARIQFMAHHDHLTACPTAPA